jgi:predicted nucleic acid-binding protein
VHEAAEVIDPDDAPILAAAKQASMDYLVTLDVRHFHTDRVKAFLPVPIVTPAEFLIAFRRHWEFPFQ